MKHLHWAIILVVCCSLSNSVQAQFNFGRMLENAVDRNVNREIDKAVDGAFEKDAQKKQNSKQGSSNQAPAATTNSQVSTDSNGNTIITDQEGNITIVGKDGSVKVISADGTQQSTTTTQNGKVQVSTNEADVTIEQTTELPTNVQPSEFIGSFDAIMQEFKKGKPTDDAATMSYYIDSYQMAVVAKTDQDQPMHSIFDRQKGTMTLLMDDDGEKTGIVMKMPKVSVKDKKGASNTDNNATMPTKTGKTKVIDGHLCYEYLMQTNDNDLLHMWVAPDMKYNFAESMNIMQMQQKGNQKDLYQQAGIDGTTLQMQIEDTKKEEIVQIDYRNFVVGKVDKSKFSTAGYQLTNMSSMGGLFGK